jgi:hypothetical protein
VARGGRAELQTEPGLALARDERVLLTADIRTVIKSLAGEGLPEGRGFGNISSTDGISMQISASARLVALARRASGTKLHVGVAKYVDGCVSDASQDACEHGASDQGDQDNN